MLPPIEIVAFDHVAMASWDASRSASMLTGILGGRFLRGDVEPSGFRWLQFDVGGGTVEVVEPMREDNFLVPFLEKRGEGLHHVTLRVRDLAGGVERLAAAGYVPVDVDLTHEDWKEAFLHPRDTGGVLIQLAQTPDDYPSGPPGPSLQELLDRVPLRRD